MGKLFVIDGTDGSGKQTQLEYLKDHLKNDNIDFRTVSFPNYESPSSSLVKMYLGGEFGDNAQEISPYVASTFYAADRYATYQKELKEYYENGGIIIADRYTTANMVHQAGKIHDEAERNKFLDWLFNLEFEIYKIPKPDVVFFLNMPVEKSSELMKDRANKITNDTKKDIHEKSKEHLEAAYKAACELVPKYGWNEIKCVENGEIRSRAEIHNEIYDIVKKELQKK